MQENLENKLKITTALFAFYSGKSYSESENYIDNIFERNMDQWIITLKEKLSELALLSSWASIVNLSEVRDNIRKAEYELKQEIKRLEDGN
jgi:hypothetical protein